MNNDYCVYMHTFPNGKRYIGITCNTPQRRWQKGYGYAHQPVVYNAIVKYGWDSIKHEVVVDKLTLDEANAKEQELITLYQTTNHAYGYNVESGGKACGHLTDEHKNKISIANSGANNGQYGRRYTEEERRQMSINSVWRGRKHSLESRKKMSEYAKAHPEIKSHPGCTHPMYGKHPSEESRKKMSESAKRRGYCGRNKKRVDMLTPEGVYIRTFESVEEAARFVNKKNGAPNIRAVCLGMRNKAHGYCWRYTDVN